MKRLATFVFIITFVFAQSGFARTTVSNTSTSTTTQNSAGTNDTAKKAGSSAGMAMVQNAIAAAGFIAAAAAAPPPQKPIFYALAAASVAAGLMMSGGKSNAGSVDKATLAAPSIGGVPGLPGSGTDTSGPGFGGGVDPTDALTDIQRDLASLGYSMSDDGSTLTTPNGQVSTAAIASGTAPGFEMTPEVKEEMDRISQEALKAASGAKVVAVGLQDGSGGGGSSIGGEQASGQFDMGKYLRDLKKRDPSSVSGLSKKLGDDNIGIKSDNIFEMISRQYKKKESQSAFMK